MKSRLISNMYGVDISSTTHNDDFLLIDKSSSLYNLNNISQPVSALFKAILTAISCMLLPKFKRKGSNKEDEV